MKTKQQIESDLKSKNTQYQPISPQLASVPGGAQPSFQRSAGMASSNNQQSSAVPGNPAGKYIPPHRRQLAFKPTDFPKASAGPSNLTGKYIPPHQRQSLSISTSHSESAIAQPLIFSTRSYTVHGQERKAQREISEQSIDIVVSGGTSLVHRDSTTHIDEDTQVVTTRMGTVITVLDNKRNTNFDILTVSKEREQRLLEKARGHNDSAMCEVAELYLSGDLGNREVNKAHYWLLKAADERKNSHAMCLLANLCESGDLGRSDPKAAMEWLEKAAERNNKYALAIVAQRYLAFYRQTKDSNDVEPTKKNEMKLKIQRYLQRSADKGSTRAMWQIAKIHEEGWFGEPNFAKAVEIYNEAGRLGSPNSLLSLQKLVEDEKVDPQQFESVLDEASTLIARTSSELAADIGLRQIDGTLGSNKERGFKLLEASAKKNNADAMKAIARCYETGRGCESNVLLSQQWYFRLKKLYEHAGSQGNVSALRKLCHLFLSGKLGAIDYEQAEKTIIKAAETGDLLSCYYLGLLYVEGRLGDKNPQKGAAWIKKTLDLCEVRAAKGDTHAIKRIIDIYLDKELGFKNYQAAFKWLVILAEQNNGVVMLRLAVLHLKGKFVGRNVKEALKWLLKASELPVSRVSWSAAAKIDQILAIKEWTEQEKQDIIEIVRNHVAQCKETTPFSIGRMLGDIFSQGILITPNYEQASYWYEKAGTFENSLALLKLGDLHRIGTFGGEDNVKAFEYFIRSAKLGNSLAQQRVLDLVDLAEKLDLQTKQLVQTWKEKKIAETARKEAVAADNENDTDSENNSNESDSDVNDSEEENISDAKLEKLFQNGVQKKGTNPNEAAHLLKRASDLGFTKATFELAELYASGQLGENVRPVAILFYKRAAQDKHLEAAGKLAIHFTAGTLVAADPIKASKWRSRSTTV